MLLLPGNRTCDVMLADITEGFAMLPGPIFPIYICGGRRGIWEAEHTGHTSEIKWIPPRCLNPRDGAGSVVTQSSGHRGPEAAACRAVPHGWSRSSFTRGSKNICRIIKGSCRTAHVPARLLSPLKCPV